MPARVSGGSKNRCSRAPASSKRRPSSPRPSTVRRIVWGTRSASFTQRFRGDGKRAAPRTGMFMDYSSRTLPGVGSAIKAVSGRDVLRVCKFDQLLQRFTIQRPVVVVIQLVAQLTALPGIDHRGNDHNQQEHLGG